MVSFNKTIKDIKSLKVQGAQNVAEASLLALKQKSKYIKAITKGRYLRELDSAKIQLFSSRPTEPCMRNCINFVLGNAKGKDLSLLKQNIGFLIEQAIDHLKFADHEVSEIGSNKIKNGMTIFTHCHSGTVMHILKRAVREKKRFEVHNTETRPLFQGRKTATELAKLGIKVTHYIDAAARLAIKKCDLMLIGADAITSEGKVINKIGSELFAEVANKFDIPVYVCTDSWKFDAQTIFGFDEAIEKRNAKEVWLKDQKG